MQFTVTNSYGVYTVNSDTYHGQLSVNSLCVCDNYYTASTSCIVWYTITDDFSL